MRIAESLVSVVLVYGLIGATAFTMALASPSVSYLFGAGLLVAGRQIGAPAFTLALHELEFAGQHGMVDAQSLLSKTYLYLKDVPYNEAAGLKWGEKAGEQADVQSQFNVGSVYLHKSEEDARYYADACKWFRRAAQQGDSAAARQLADLLQNGKGTTKDLKEAFEWNLKAAEYGNEEGQYHAAVCLLEGEGTSKDPKLANSWLEKSSDQGSLKAKVLLAKNCLSGTGTTSDTTRAALLLREAAAVGAFDSHLLLAEMNALGVIDRSGELEKEAQAAASQGSSIGKFLTSRSLSKKTSREVLNSLSKIANAGNAAAQACLGDAYAYGIGVAPDEQISIAWYEKAAQNGDRDAQHRLWRKNKDVRFLEQSALAGNSEAEYSLALEILEHREGLTTGLAAQQWFEKAAAKGNVDAQLELATQYRRGKGPAFDERAAKFARRLAETGWSEAQYVLCCTYISVQDADRDTAKEWAKRAADLGLVIAQASYGRFDSAYMQKAADQGDILAKLEVGKLYWTGDGVDRDRKRAVGYFKQAAAAGNAEAQCFLAQANRYGKGVKEDTAEAVRLYKLAMEQGSPEAREELQIMQEEQAEPE